MPEGALLGCLARPREECSGRLLTHPKARAAEPRAAPRLVGPPELSLEGAAEGFAALGSAGDVVADVDHVRGTALEGEQAVEGCDPVDLGGGQGEPPTDVVERTL